MKRFIVILLLFPLALTAQTLKHNEYDKVAKQWLIESFPVNLKSSQEISMDISLRFVDTTFFIELTGSGIGANIVGMDDRLIFLLDNDSTVTAKSPTVQTYDYSKAMGTYSHKYVLYFEDLEYLSQHNLQALRKYAGEKYDDIYVDPKNADKVKELSAHFLSELKNENVLVAKLPSSSPSFPGGSEVLTKFLNRNLKTPPEFQTDDKKVVVVQFLVKGDGSVTDMRITQSAGPYFDNETLRVLNRMPKWKPALQNGKAVNEIVTLPVTFHPAKTFE